MCQWRHLYGAQHLRLRHRLDRRKLPKPHLHQRLSEWRDVHRA
jgi:hypothetical protein